MGFKGIGRGGGGEEPWGCLAVFGGVGALLICFTSCLGSGGAVWAGGGGAGAGFRSFAFAVSGVGD